MGDRAAVRAGAISHALALKHASVEYERYQEGRWELLSAEPSSDFDRFVDAAKQLADATSDDIE